MLEIPLSRKAGEDWGEGRPRSEGSKSPRPALRAISGERSVPPARAMPENVLSFTG